MGKKDKRMTQCSRCYEWFHNDCGNVPDTLQPESECWDCEWCKGGTDKEGYQRWGSNRKKPKKRHFRDTPRLNGTEEGMDHPLEYSFPWEWDEVVLEVREMARRAAVKNKRLKDEAQSLIDEGLPGKHHLLDRVGGNGLESRGVDDELVDELIELGLLQKNHIDEDKYDSED